MFVEELLYNEETYYVAIIELSNSKQLTKDELLVCVQTANSDKDILAIQLLNPEKIAGVMHLLSAAQNALNAWLGSYAITRSLSMEITVYASAQRQIDRAMEWFGLHDRLPTIAAIIIGLKKSKLHQVVLLLERLIGSQIEPPFTPSQERLVRISEFFKIPQNELDTLTTRASLIDQINALNRCIASRISLLAVST